MCACVYTFMNTRTNKFPLFLHFSYFYKFQLMKLNVLKLFYINTLRNFCLQLFYYRKNKNKSSLTGQKTL